MIRKLSGGRLPSKPVLGLGSPTKFATPPSSITQSQRMSRRVNERAPLKPVAQVREQKNYVTPVGGGRVSTFVTLCLQVKVQQLF